MRTITQRLTRLSTTWLTASLLASATLAAPIEVTTTDATSSTECTLTDAIDTAQNGASQGECTWSGDAIVEIEEGFTYPLASSVATVSSDLVVRGEFSAVDPAEIVWDTGQSGRFFDVASGGDLELTNLNLIGGSGYDGGALRVQAGGTAHVFGVWFEDNDAGFAGGAIDNAGTLAVEKSTFDGNSAPFAGGAIFNDGSGTVYVVDSLFADNEAALGGAFYQDGDDVAFETSTFSANDASLGGAIYGKSSDISVDFSTFRNNDGSTGSAIYMEWGSIDIGRSALTATSSQSSLCNGSTYVTSDTGNVLSDSSCGSATGDDVVGAEIVMSDLLHHGGHTQVHVPICEWDGGGCDSPLLDRDDLSLCSSSSADRDQRDQFDRIDLTGSVAAHGGTVCDVGSYESVCQTYDQNGADVTVYLHEYQVGDSDPILLDNGDCFGHELWEEEETADCSITWSVMGTRLKIVDIVFLDPECEVACFPDTSACESSCTGSGGVSADNYLPSGWSETDNTNGTYTIDAPNCTIPELDEGVAMRYLIGLEDSTDPNATTFYWDPLTPLTNSDTSGGGG